MKLLDTSVCFQNWENWETVLGSAGVKVFRNSNIRNNYYFHHEFSSLYKACIFTMHAYMVKMHGKFRILGIYLLLEYWDGEDRIEKTATETKVRTLKFKKTGQRTSNFHQNRISDSSKLNNFVSFSEKSYILFFSFESKLRGLPCFPTDKDTKLRRQTGNSYPHS